ncbi:hypothetical protein RB597_003614 [Gaeumannomyces tritici]
MVELNRDGSRLTFKELQIALLGMILSRWNVPVSQTDRALRFLLKIASALPSNPDTRADGWIGMLVSPIMEYLQGDDLAAELVSLGRRRPNFIPTHVNRPPDLPFFGLLQINTVLRLVPSYHDRTNLMLRLALRAAGLRDRRFAIAFVAHGQRKACCVDPVSGNNADEMTLLNLQVLEWEGWASFQAIDGTVYGFHLGDPDYAAIFVESSTLEAHTQPPCIENEDIVWAIRRDMIDLVGLKKLLTRRQLQDADKIMIALCKLGYASRVYQNLSRQGASISPKALHATFGVMWYLPDDPQGETLMGYIDRLHEAGPTLAMRFISFFETGILLPDTFSQAAGAIGIAVGDSIYVPTRLLSDPAVHTDQPYKFSRLLGNIGRPGLSILTTPAAADLQARDSDLGLWQKAPPRFNGEREDAFSRTSMHIGFTEWQAPLFHTGSVGQHSSEVSHVEVVVSVRDSGEWVADVNPLLALGHFGLQQLPWKTVQGRAVHNYPQELHGDGEKHQNSAGREAPGGDETGGEATALSVFDRDEMVALESWDQILDLPEGVLVIKSYGNWISRLAIMSVISHHCKLKATRVYICPEDVCWECVRRDTPHSVYIY